MNWELVVDKTIDFFLVFIGLYAAIAVQRYQDDRKAKAEYAVLLQDFQSELKANRAQHGTIERDLGALTQLTPGAVLGPMEAIFTKFENEMLEDEELLRCLHREFATLKPKGVARPASNPRCHVLYTAFDKAASERKGQPQAPHFEPAILSPFYRYEVWELYDTTGARLFKNKDLAVKIAEVYNNARLIEKQVAEIETTYNDIFMKQVGRMTASEAGLVEVIHDEEVDHGLSSEDLAELAHIGEEMKDERFATLEAKSILEAKIRRMKNTVQKTNGEIELVVERIGQELSKVTK